MLFVFYCHLELELTNKSISFLVGHSKVTTLAFTFVVYLHSYALQSYLVILAEYLGTTSFHFKFVTLNCLMYVISLIVLTYLPMTEYRDAHNALSVIAFFFASLSIFIHKHGFIEILNDYLSGSFSESNEPVKELAVTEFLFLIGVLVSELVFWFTGSALSEYIFIGLILLDKEFKIFIMSRSGLINTRDNAMLVVYVSPPNNEDIAALEASSRTKDHAHLQKPPIMPLPRMSPPLPPPRLPPPPRQVSAPPPEAQW